MLGVPVYLAEGLKYPEPRAPHTVTCRVGIGESPAALSSLLPAIQESNSSEAFSADDRISDHDVQPVPELKDCGVVLAGLHACGDLSATMLRLVTSTPQPVHQKSRISATP